MTAQTPTTSTEIEAIGVDLGGTKMLVGVCSGDGEIHYRNVTGSRALSQEEVLLALETEIEAALDARPCVGAIGLGVPCTIDRERGLCVNAANLPLVDVPLKRRIEDRFGLPVELDNDCNTAAIAEHRLGAGRGATNLVYFAMGTGIGGGLILGGRLYRGSHGAGGELGHVVVDLHGPRCQGSCPNHGCIESIGSGTALGTLARETAAAQPESRLGRIAAEGGTVDGAVVTSLASSGDELAIGVLGILGERIGVALSGLANVFDPDVIVLGGGVMAGGSFILEPAREQVRARALPPQRDVPVERAQLGGESAMVGAALVAHDLLVPAAEPSAEPPTGPSAESPGGPRPESDSLGGR